MIGFSPLVIIDPTQYMVKNVTFNAYNFHRIQYYIGQLYDILVESETKFSSQPLQDLRFENDNFFLDICLKFAQGRLPVEAQ